MKINDFTNYLSLIFVKRSEWVFISLALASSLMRIEDDRWNSYLSVSIEHFLILFPILIFKWYFDSSPRNNKVFFIGAWLTAFILYPTTFFLGTWLLGYETEARFFGYMLMAASVLELVLLTEQWRSTQRFKVQLLSKIGINEIILFFMIVLSLYLGLLICSDLPLWRKSNLVGEVIHWQLIWQTPGQVLWISFQVFALLFCGYLFFWVNQKLLVKTILKERGFLLYIIASLSCVVVLYPVVTSLYLLFPINEMGEPIIPAVEANPFDWANGKVFLAVILISFPILLVSRWHQQANQLTKLEKERVKTELSLLKQQLDPHFMLNTLNNLYALCRKQSEKAPEVVLQLAELMQYVVYKGQDETVRLQDEIDYLEDYLCLQGIRSQGCNKIQFDKNIESNDRFHIAPMLFIVLVENAFKHGDEGTNDEPWLKISIAKYTDKLVFNCNNKVKSKAGKHVEGGVGLDNLQQRLALLYPNSHQLTIVQKGDWFCASLALNIS